MESETVRVTSVKDLMARKVTTLNLNDSLDMAEGLMILGRIRHVPIVDDDGRVVGMVSNRDIFRSALAFALGYGDRGRSSLLRTVKVKEVMSEPVVTIDSGASIADAARLMVEHRIGCLPVVDGGVLVGMVSEVDILRQVITAPRP